MAIRKKKGYDALILHYHIELLALIITFGVEMRKIGGVVPMPY